MNNTFVAFDLIGLTVGVIYIIYKLGTICNIQTQILLELADIRRKLSKKTIT